MVDGQINPPEGEAAELNYDLRYAPFAQQLAEPHFGHEAVATEAGQQNAYGGAPQWPNGASSDAALKTEALPEAPSTYRPADQLAYPYPGAYESIGLGIDYNTRPQSTDTYTDPGTVGSYDSSALSQQPYHPLPGQSQSPPTPSASDRSIPGQRTRSKRAAAARADTPKSSGSKPNDKAKITKPPPPKKATRQPKKERTTPQLAAPLSELTKCYSNIPIKNMEEWVNRPVEVRWQEVEARNGYVTRPMNSFMLYRSAYAERTKTWCLQNNHQVVSSVSGESWPMEPPEIREKYNNYARIERENHQLAHPGYKFSPTKPNIAKKKKNASSDIEASEASDAEGAGDEWRGGARSTARSRMTRQSAAPRTTPNDDPAHGVQRIRNLPTGVGAHLSSYQATNPGRPAPSAMEPHDLYYYQTTVHPNVMGPYVQDVRMMKTEMPESGGTEQLGLVGLPGMLPNEMHYGRQYNGASLPQGEQAVDPLLLTMDGTRLAAGPEHALHDSHPSFQHAAPTSAFEGEARMGMAHENLAAPHLNSQNQHHHHGAEAANYGGGQYNVGEHHGSNELPHFSRAFSGDWSQWASREDVRAELENWYERGHG